MTETRTIPKYPCWTTVTYVFDEPADVIAIAAGRGTVADENHYPPHHGSAEHWIVVCRWSDNGVHFTAQSGHTLAPTLAGIDASPVS